MGLRWGAGCYWPVCRPSLADSGTCRTAAYRFWTGLWLWGRLYYFLSRGDQYRDDHWIGSCDWHTATLYQLWRIFSLELHHLAVCIDQTGFFKNGAEIKNLQRIKATTFGARLFRPGKC